MSGFAEKLNIQNFVNLAGIVYIIYVRNIWFCGETEYSKFVKFNEKLCTLYMYEISGFAEKLNIFKYINSTGNYVCYTYGMSGFANKLKIQNCVNSTGKCVH